MAQDCPMAGSLKHGKKISVSTKGTEFVTG